MTSDVHGQWSPIPHKPYHDLYKKNLTSVCLLSYGIMSQLACSLPRVCNDHDPTSSSRDGGRVRGSSSVASLDRPPLVRTLAVASLRRWRPSSIHRVVDVAAGDEVTLGNVSSSRVIPARHNLHFQQLLARKFMGQENQGFFFSKCGQNAYLLSKGYGILARTPPETHHTLGISERRWSLANKKTKKTIVHDGP